MIAEYVRSAIGTGPGYVVRVFRRRLRGLSVVGEYEGFSWLTPGYGPACFRGWERGATRCDRRDYSIRFTLGRKPNRSSWRCTR